MTDGMASTLASTGKPPITVEELKRALPPTFKESATKELADTINAITADPVLAEHIRDNFITYANVLMEGRFSLNAYISAIQYATFKFMGYSNQEAYFRTFPQRQAEFIATGKSSKDISAYVSAYHKNKMVTAILEKALIPIHVLYQDVHHDAIRTQADLMRTATSELVRMQAANSLLTHLAKPKEAANMQVAIQVNNNSEMDAMRKMLSDLSEQQLRMVDVGVSAKDLAGQKLVVIDHQDSEG